MPPVGCCTFLTLESTTTEPWRDQRAGQRHGAGPAADAAGQHDDDHQARPAMWRLIDRARVLRLRLPALS